MIIYPAHRTGLNIFDIIFINTIKDCEPKIELACSWGTIYKL